MIDHNCQLTLWQETFRQTRCPLIRNETASLHLESWMNLKWVWNQGRVTSLICGPSCLFCFQIQKKQEGPQMRLGVTDWAQCQGERLFLNYIILICNLVCDQVLPLYIQCNFLIIPYFRWGCYWNIHVDVDGWIRIWLQWHSITSWAMLQHHFTETSRLVTYRNAACAPFWYWGLLLYIFLPHFLCDLWTLKDNHQWLECAQSEASPPISS